MLEQRGLCGTMSSTGRAPVAPVIPRRVFFIVIAGLDPAIHLASPRGCDPGIHISKHNLARGKQRSNAVSAAQFQQPTAQVVACGFSGVNSRKRAPWHFASSAILSGSPSACGTRRRMQLRLVGFELRTNLS